MTTFERPADDRDDAVLAALEASNRPVDEGAICALTNGTVQLIPLRYGLVESLEPGCPTPYSLSARPLGLRLMRNGYLYVFDATTGELDEYHFSDQGSRVSGKLEYPTDRTLHVCFSEIPWSEAKRDQIRDSSEDRDALMQRVDLASAGPVTGGEHLIPLERAAQWVAEFAEDHVPDTPKDGHSQEGEAYHWENEPYYHKTRIGKLHDAHEIVEPDECLCLLVRDDLGVMRDLAQFQDNVVDWIDAWAEEDGKRNERDFVLGSYIDSLITVGEERLQACAEAGDTPVIALFEETSEAQRQFIYEHLAIRRDHRGAIPMGGEAYWRDARHADNPYVQSYLAMREALGEALYTRHRDLIVQLNLETFQALNGRHLGQRGVAGLIDRGGMERFLAAQRRKIARWSELLDAISADRTAMIVANRFHTAAWYFDPREERQVEAALLAEYACTRDICRNDDAIDGLHAWLEDNPAYDRPLFHTLPLQEQTALANRLLDLASSTQALSGRLPDLLENTQTWADRLRELETGSLPDIDEMPEAIQAANEHARANLAPALGKGVERALSSLGAVLDGGQLPPLESLFRDLPKALGWRLLDAARQGQLSFMIEDDALAGFRRRLQEVVNLRDELRSLNGQRRQTRGQHRSDAYVELARERRRVQQRLARLEAELASMLSPLESLPDERIDIVPSTDDRRVGLAKAGVTLAIAGNSRDTRLLRAGGFIGDLRHGVRAAPPADRVGNALALAIFFGQAVNLWLAYQSLETLPSHQQDDERRRLQERKIREAFAATAAAGFLGAQGIGHTALVARATQLGQLLDQTGVDRVYVRLGVMHLALGGIGYLAGFIASITSIRQDFARWQTAVRHGNSGAQTAALVAMGGGGGMAGVSGYALNATRRTLADVIFRGLPLKAAGRYLGQIMIRFNALGAIFTVLQLAGTWAYHRYNLSQHDRWLRSTPWGSRNADAGLEEYIARLQIATQPSYATLVRRERGYLLGIVLPSIDRATLVAPLGGQAPVRVALQAWQIHPASAHGAAGPGPASPGERWLPATDTLAATLAAMEQPGIPGLAITTMTPERRSTPEHYAVGVRIEWLDEHGRYQPSERYIYVNPRLGSGIESHYPASDELRPPMVREADWFPVDPRLVSVYPDNADNG